MPFEEADAQTALMNELSRLNDRLRGLMSTNELLLSPRYAAPRQHVAEALECLVNAEAAVGFVPRLSD